MKRAARPRRAFTVIELLVALAIGATAVLIVRLGVEVIAQASVSISRAARRTDREANRDALVRGLLGRVESGITPDDRFVGDAQIMAFTTWCDAPGGYQSRCRIRLEATAHGSSDTIRLLMPDDAVAVWTDIRTIDFRYLVIPTPDGWRPTWNDPVRAPLAISIRFARDGEPDSVFVRIGERG